jgi:hypothetical protein
MTPVDDRLDAVERDVDRVRGKQHVLTEHSAASATVPLSEP